MEDNLHLTYLRKEDNLKKKQKHSTYFQATWLTQQPTVYCYNLNKKSTLVLL